jgi:hypothetical protein
MTDRVGVPVSIDQWGWQCGFHPVIVEAGSSSRFDAASVLSHD